MVNYTSRSDQTYVEDPNWNKQIDLAIELACLRGDLKSIKNNPVARKALLAALDF